MDLLDLEVMIPGLGISPSSTDLHQLFAAFQADFITSPMTLNGLRVKIVLHLSRVEGFTGFPETFVHLVTRKSSGGKRVFDPFRANKVHWIRPILENRSSEDVLFFEFREDDGGLREYYWFREGDFIVIMERITPDYVIVTSFNVDPENERYFQRRYDAYRKSR